MSDRRVAVITGSSRGIGAACAVALAAADYDVVVHGVGPSAALAKVTDAITSRGGRAIPLTTDLADPKAASSFGSNVLAAVGRVDVLINNAAVRPAQRFLDMSWDDWQRVLAIDLHAAFHTTQAFAPGMLERGYGRIINITGLNAMHGYAGHTHVSVAKHGLWGLTKSLAKEFGEQGVTVNAISPGLIDTHGDRIPPDQLAQLAARIPSGRIGQPEEIASLCVYLASAGAGFLTGQMIAVNGGAQT